MCGALLLQALAPDGGSLVVGTSKGRLLRYDIVATAAAATATQQQQQQQTGAGTSTGSAGASAAAAREPSSSGSSSAMVTIDEGSKRELKCLGSCHSDAIDCLVSGRVNAAS